MNAELNHKHKNWNLIIFYFTDKLTYINLNINLPNNSELNEYSTASTVILNRVEYKHVKL